MHGSVRDGAGKRSIHTVNGTRADALGGLCAVFRREERSLSAVGGCWSRVLDQRW